MALAGQQLKLLQEALRRFVVVARDLGFDESDYSLVLHKTRQWHSNLSLISRQLQDIIHIFELPHGRLDRRLIIHRLFVLLNELKVLNISEAQPHIDPVIIRIENRLGRLTIGLRWIVRPLPLTHIIDDICHQRLRELLEIQHNMLVISLQKLIIPVLVVGVEELLAFLYLSCVHFTEVFIDGLDRTVEAEGQLRTFLLSSSVLLL